MVVEVPAASRASGAGCFLSACIMSFPYGIDDPLALDLHGEGHGADAPGVGKLQEQSVAPFARERCVEGYLRSCGPLGVLGVHMQEGKVSLAQRYKVSQGPEVRLEVSYGLPFPADAEHQRAPSACGICRVQCDLVTLDTHGVGGIGERRGLVVARHGEIRA